MKPLVILNLLFKLQKFTIRLKAIILFIIFINYNINNKLFNMSMRYIKINFLRSFIKWVCGNMSQNLE